MLDKNSTTNEFLHQVFQQHHLDHVPEIELTSNDLLVDLARIGLGNCLCAGLLYKKHRKRHLSP